MSRAIAAAVAVAVGAEATGVTNFSGGGSGDGGTPGLGNIQLPDIDLPAPAPIDIQLPPAVQQVRDTANTAADIQRAYENGREQGQQWIQDARDTIQVPARPESGGETTGDSTPLLGPLWEGSDERLRDRVAITDNITLGSTVADVTGFERFVGENGVFPEQDGSLRRLLTTPPQDTAADGLQRLGSWVASPTIEAIQEADSPDTSAQRLLDTVKEQRDELDRRSSGSSGSSSGPSFGSSGSSDLDSFSSAADRLTQAAEEDPVEQARNFRRGAGLGL